MLKIYLASLCLSIVQAALRPIVLWHGMGDSCCNEKSLGAIAESIRDSLTDKVKIFSFELGAGGQGADSKASFFGNLNDQVAVLNDCLTGVTTTNGRLIDLETLNPATIKDIEMLRGHGFNAMGFSQGGQALRAYVERFNNPQVYNLVTFGSQHQGVSDIPNCQDDDYKLTSTFWCNLARGAIKRGVYVPSIQAKIVQAQYYKDISQYDAYLSGSIFLPDVNNEVEVNSLYRENMVKLSNLVLVQFSQDKMVYPKESAHFGFWDTEVGTKDVIIPLRDSKIYSEDRIGLKSLDLAGKLKMLTVDGDHLRFTLEWLNEHITAKFLNDPVVPQFTIQSSE